MIKFLAFGGHQMNREQKITIGAALTILAGGIGFLLDNGLFMQIGNPCSTSMPRAMAFQNLAIGMLQPVTWRK